MRGLPFSISKKIGKSVIRNRIRRLYYRDIRKMHRMILIQLMTLFYTIVRRKSKPLLTYGATYETRCKEFLFKRAGY